MKNLEQVKNILATSGCYCWTLSAVDGYQLVPLHSHKPKGLKAGSEESKGLRPEKEDDEPGEKELAKLMDESLSVLASLVRGFDTEPPSKTFSVVYSASRTAHGKGVNGPIKFTQLDPPAEPAPVAVVQQSLGGVQTPGYGMFPQFGDQLNQMVQLTGVLQAGQRDTVAILQQNLADRIAAVDRQSAQLSELERQLRSEFRDRDERLEKQYKERIQEKKDELDERYAERERQLEREHAERKKRHKKKVTELEAKVEKAEAVGTKVGAGILGTIQMVGKLANGENPLAGFAGAGAPKQEEPQDEYSAALAKLTKAIAATQNVELLIAVGCLVHAAGVPGLLGEVVELTKQRFSENEKRESDGDQE